MLIATVGSACGQILYSVKGRGLKGESYILFVDNMLPSSSLIGVKNVFKCYNRTKTVVCEYNEEASWDKIKQMLNNSSTTLSANITKREAAMVDSILRVDGKITLGKVEMLKPAAVKMIWENEICRSMYERGEEDAAMDSYFQQVALIEGKNVMALDSSVAYESLSEEIGAQTRKMVEGLSHGRDSIEKRYKKAEMLFRLGDVKGLGEVQSEGNEEKQVEKWVDKLVNAMRGERCFVVLYAKYYNGLMEKLKKKRIKTNEVK
ncbi:MAG: hypothetical protein MJ002_03620 [Paludibacteraceae bacterium]|nr:hypothetical protein [Paludibacteraceae bacterium]